MDTETFDPATGEILPARDPDPRSLPEPTTLDELNRQMHLLTSWLGQNTRERVRIRKELRPVQERYTAVYNAALLASNRSEATLRKAEAEMAVRSDYMPGDVEPVAERLSILQLQLKTAEMLGHDARAVMSGLQTIAKTLITQAQADMSMAGRIT